MDVGHEGVKMRPPLPRGRGGVEEHVHQHRLAAADRPVDVEAARRVGRLRAEQAREAARLALRLVAVQFRRERVELVRQFGLGGVEREPAAGDERAVTISNGSHLDGGPRLIRAMAIAS